MSALEIAVSSYGGRACDGVQRALFEQGGTIGRGAECTLCLSDPQRYLSRLQARLLRQRDNWIIVNESQANSLFVGSKEVGKGEQTSFSPGEDIRIGLYVLSTRMVTDAHQKNGNELSVTPQPSAPVVEVAAIDPLFLDFSDTSTSENPFEDLLQPQVPIAETPALSTSERTEKLLENQKPDTPITDDSPQDISETDFWSRLEQDYSKPKKAIEGIGSATMPQGNLLKQTETAQTDSSHASEDDEVSLDILAYGKKAVEQVMGVQLDQSHIPLENEDSEPLSIVDVTADIDPLKLFDKAETPDETIGFLPKNRPMQDNILETGAFFSPPIMKVEKKTKDVHSMEATQKQGVEQTQQPDIKANDEHSPIEAKISSKKDSVKKQTKAKNSLKKEIQPDETASEEAESTVTTTNILLDGFLEGLQQPSLTTSHHLTQDFMRQLGAIIHTSVHGTMDLMMARTLVKREVKADQTMISPDKNNPLKFLPSSEAALIQMFGNKIPGFMPPVDALEDAYRDLRAHQVGIIVGMRAALLELIKRFDPDVLLDKYEEKTSKTMLPIVKKAKMWDFFMEHFRKMLEEAEEDFQKLFGEAFLKAYEEEIKRLREEGKR